MPEEPKARGGRGTQATLPAADATAAPRSNGATALVAAPPAAPPAPYVPYEYDEGGLAFNLKPEDVKAPVIRIIQKGMPPRDPKLATVPAGHFALNTTGEDLGDSIHVVVLGVIRSRARLRPFNEQGRGKNSILCRSFDALHGKGDPGGDCENCPFAGWQEGESAPQCTFSLNYFVLPLQVEDEVIVDSKLRVGEFATPAILRLAKKSLTEARLWNDTIKLHKPPFGVVYRLDVVEVANPRNPNVPLYLPKHHPAHIIRDRTILDVLYGYAQSIGREGARAIEAANETEPYDDPDTGGGEPPLAGVAQSGGGPSGDEVPF